jgi:hypothetical protein
MSPMALADGTPILLLVASLSTLLVIRRDSARSMPHHPLLTPHGASLSNSLRIYDAYNTDLAKALLSQAMTATIIDTSRCKGAEVAICADLQVRQPGHPSGILVIACHSGQGSADRHPLHTADTRAQDTSRQICIVGAPLLSLALATTAGTARGALQIAHTFAARTRAGQPELLASASLYQYCRADFALARFSSDDGPGCSSAWRTVTTRPGPSNIAVFANPGLLSSQDRARLFLTMLRQKPHNHIGAQESDLWDGLNDALQAVARPRPDLIFVPGQASDVSTLIQEIAKPAVMIGGESMYSSLQQELVPWAQRQQLTRPHLYPALITAPRPPLNPWQKQFYASFCSATAALDQGGLHFIDSVEMSGQVTPLPENRVLHPNHGTAPVLPYVQGDGSMHIAGELTRSACATSQRNICREEGAGWNYW